MSLSDIKEILKDRPINSILDDVANHVLSASVTVTIINAETGAGKSILIPSEIASKSDEPIIVLLPRRHLCVNLCETVSELAGIEVGGEINWVTGIRGRENRPYVSGYHHITYMTVGYALASKAVLNASIIFIDEAHENSLDMTICKALLLKRLEEDKSKDLKIIIMSATIDTQAEKRYWRGYNPKIFTATGKSYPCEFIENVDEDIHQIAYDLVVNENRKGVLVFLEGIGEIRDVKEKLLTLLNESSSRIDIQIITGDSSYDERKEACNPINHDEYDAKILLGTNVIESGFNLPWVDSGVSSGIGKVSSIDTSTSAVHVIPEDLPKWRLDQQKGRVNRFGPGIFILASDVPYDKRPDIDLPEILRVPLTELVMHCSKLDIKAEELKFFPQPDLSEIRKAETTLRIYGFIDEYCKLTEQGKFASTLPVGIKSAAMLYKAKELGMLELMLPFAAINETTHILKNTRMIPGYDRESDLINMTKLFIEVFNVYEDDHYISKSYVAEKNLSFKRFKEAYDAYIALIKHFSTDDSIDIGANHTVITDIRTDSILYKEIKCCIFAGYVTNFYKTINTPRGLGLSDTRGLRYSCESASVVSVQFPRQYPNAVAALKVIRPRNGNSPFTVGENITIFSEEDLEYIVSCDSRLQVSYDPMMRYKVYTVLQTPNYKISPSSNGTGDSHAETLRNYFSRT
jgi:HrpA-like RNA helicase